MEKRFVEEEDLLLDAYRLGVKIYESGFRPTFIVGLWRGGSAVGIVVQECLQTLGVEPGACERAERHLDRLAQENRVRSAVSQADLEAAVLARGGSLDRGEASPSER